MRNDTKEILIKSLLKARLKAIVQSDIIQIETELESLGYDLKNE
jgi:hypothetical protein